MRVLHMTSDLDGGGVDSVLYSYCSRMLPKVQCDFVVTSDKEGILEEPLRAMGSQVFHVAKMRENLKLRQGQLREILAKGQYSAVHDHSGYKSYFFLNLARQMGVKCRIAHAHIAFIPETTTAHLERVLITPLTKAAATHLFACGTDAGSWMWGADSVAKNRVTVMPNGIDTRKFQFSPKTRDEVRYCLGLSEKFVVGNVARLSEQKNHDFLLESFAHLLHREPAAVLMLVGRGELEEHLKKKAAELGIDKAVMFLGIRNDVYQLINAMDVFVLPSKYEGLPVTLVEAQANGLPVVVSNAVTDEIRIANNYDVLSLSSGTEEWAEHILKMNGQRAKDVSKVADAYDIDILAQKQMKWYLAHE